MRRPLTPRRAPAGALLGWALIALIGCNLTLPPAHIPPTLPRVLLEQPTPSPTPPDPLNGLEDAGAALAGVCFEAAYQRRDTPFVFGSENELARFYDEIDAAQHCRHPLARGAFDFSEGRKLVGVWSYGVGCTASHTLTQQRDEASRTLRLSAVFSVEGDCSYELIRPLWVAVSLSESWQAALDVTQRPLGTLP
jgi:hypothetical protein